MLINKKTVYSALLVMCCCIINTSSFGQIKVSTDGITSNPEWSEPYAPFRIVGNLYYVGTYDIACYLITTRKGHILINVGLKETVPQIVANVETLGFDFSDIKILLTNQAHFDHVGGMYLIKNFTGAKLMVDSADGQVMADGGKSDYLFGGETSLFDPVQPDRLLVDGDVIKLGKMKITMLHHPGHTKGSCSFIFDVKKGGHKYKVLIANAPKILAQVNFATTPKKYPDVIKDFAYTYKAMRQLKFDLWFAAHASQCNLHDKRSLKYNYNPEAYRDQAGYDTMITTLEAEYIKKLNMQ